MSIIADDIWDKFEFEDNHVDLLLASFATTNPAKEEIVRTKADEWMGDPLYEDWAAKVDLNSSEQLEGYDNGSNSVCSDCMWNGNCVRKGKQPNPNIKRDVKDISSVMKLNFDSYESERSHMMEQFDFGVAENDEAKVKTKKRKRSVKNAPVAAKKLKTKMQEKNNNVDLYCYEKMNEQMNNNHLSGPRNMSESDKLKSTSIVLEEKNTSKQFPPQNKLDINDQSEVKVCAKLVMPKRILFSEENVAKEVQLNDVESLNGNPSGKDLNSNVHDEQSQQQNKNKHEIMNCYEILNLFDDKVKNQQIQVETSETVDTISSLTKPVTPSRGGKSHSRNTRVTREEKDLRNQRDRERNIRLDQGYRELSRLVPELSLPPNKQLTVKEKREVLQKTARYCSYLVNRSLVLRKEIENETKRNLDLQDALMLLSAGNINDGEF